MHDPYKQIIVSLFFCFILVSFFFIYKGIFKRNLPLFPLLILISVLPIISIFRPGTYEAGDLTLHSVFLQSFYENLKDGILFPQWAGGLCGGYGCPVFLFEYTSPFYIGAFFHFFGFSYLDSMKLFLAVSYMLSGITMYIFLRDMFKKHEAFIGSLLYLFAPIHLMEMHFRVSVGTHVAFVFVPLAFLFAKKALSGNLLYIILGAINFLLLILSHSSISFVIIPFSIIYAFLVKKKLADMKYVFLSIFLGAGISTFYVLPALFELQYTWYSQTIKVVDDFKPIAEYIYSPARFGLLFQGNNGELRLIVGYAQLFVIFFSVYLLIKNKITNKDKQLVYFLLIIFFLCFTLMLSITKDIWNNTFFLKSFVLPWRMLVPIAFATAFLGAIVTKYLNKFALIIFSLVIVLSTILNWGNRKMVAMDPNAYANHWSLYTEYFEPNSTLYNARYTGRVGVIPELVQQPPSAHLEILEGKGVVKELKRSQIDHEYITYGETPIQLSENTYYFPGWKILIDGKETNVNITNKSYFGTLTFSTPKGLHTIQAKFQDTPIRKTGKVISFIFVTIIGALLVFYLSRRK